MARGQIEEVSVGAGEVRPISSGRVLAVGAPVGGAAQAHVAVVTGEHGGVHDAVALFHVGTPVVGSDTVTQVFDYAGSFVPHDPAGGRKRIVFLGLVTAPGVQVRAADAGLGHA